MTARLLALALLAGLLVPATAAAHSGAGTAVDYETLPAGLRTAAGEPIPGAELTVHGGDDRLELTWRGDGELVVLGYADEPYLRLGPEGAFENARSPSVESNRERFGPVVGEGSADPEAAPEWRRIGDEAVAVWHDHRTHWMSQGAPPAGVSDAPEERQVVQTYVIPVLIDGQAAQIPGRLEYVPPPSPWPYVAALLVLALAAVGLVARGAAGVARATTRIVAGLGMGAGAALLVADALAAPRSGLTAGTTEAVPPLVQAGLWLGAAGLLAVLWGRAARRGAGPEAVVMLIGTWVLAGIAGLGRISYLDHAVVPGLIPGDVARILVVLCLGALPVPAAYAWRTLGRLRSVTREAAPTEPVMRTIQH